MSDPICTVLPTSPLGKMVTIPIATYEGLKQSDAMLCALEAAGVDSWDGYEEAQEMLNG